MNNVECPPGQSSENFKTCYGCGAALHRDAMFCPHCGAPHQQEPAASQKSKPIAILLALFLGGLGGHKFYLGQRGKGVLYLIFCWTAVPMVIAWVEAILLIVMSDGEFRRRFP